MCDSGMPRHNRDLRVDLEMESTPLYSFQDRGYGKQSFKSIKISYVSIVLHSSYRIHRFVMPHHNRCVSKFETP